MKPESKAAASRMLARYTRSRMPRARTITLTGKQQDALARSIVERIKDMWLCGAFDEKMNIEETAVEVLDEIRRAR